MSSPAARALTLLAVCLAVGLIGTASVAHAQVVDSPLDSEEAKEQGLPFRGTSFSLLQTLATNSFSKSSQLSYDPYYNLAFDLNLVWHFTRRFQVILNQALQVELTESNSTRLTREPLWSDTAGTFDALLVKQAVNPEFGWQLHSSVTLSAPTSLASQAASVILGLRLGAVGTISLPKVLSGMGINAGFSYLHRFMDSNVVSVGEPYPCAAGDTSLQYCTALGGRSNTQNSIGMAFSSELALDDKWGVSASYAHSWRRGADLADYTYVSDDGTTETLVDGSDRHWRNASTINIGVSYLVINWLGLGLDLTNIFDERGPDSELRPPFRLVDTYLGLSMFLRIDELYITASGGPKERDTASRSRSSALH